MKEHKIEDFIKKVKDIKNIKEQWDTEIIIENEYYSIQIGILYIKEIYYEEKYLWIITDDERMFNLKIIEDTDYRITKRLR